MTSFEHLLALAAANAGGDTALDASLPAVSSATELAETGTDRYLSAMALCIFRAGFVWKVVDNKWPQFETVFAAFNPMAVAHFSDEKLEQLGQDARIIRNATKISAVRDNAVFILTEDSERGSFARTIAEWPVTDIVGLWRYLASKGSRLGGNSGPMFLRTMGKDTFIMTKDVCSALVNHGLTDAFSVTSWRDLNRVQQVFNRLHEQTGRPLSHLSKILAYTV